ncbi:peptidoglycan editing factor PgeF [Devosia aurantiaca]|uniref:Purine nucleoside phosphorylase n=1 Tax=Devosia aurantiaca TaxID=2714858 RepID=A0A6M1SM35_9HYPH|nr:peptidoglycan editing factor PgeF [Devosia aurantiaca]NGP18248.1 peptidoglycan editing factor PgeF [Devosia aurantiaca]
MTPVETAETLSELSGIRHGFFGRAGGVSGGEFEGLNVSWSVGDDSQIVEQNRELVRDAIGVGPLVILRQTHSTHVVTVSGAVEPSSLEGDALVTATPGLVLSILTADCTPVLFADKEAGVIGAAHAGWRGAAEGILPKTLDAMVAIGADLSRIHAAIGPTIYGPDYEVGDKFMADFLAIDPSGAAHFSTPPGGQPHFDLPGFVEEQLRAAGLAAVERVGSSTYRHPDRYFSHRYATHQKTRTGRQISVIGLA